MEEDGFCLLVGKTLTNVIDCNNEVLFVCDDESAFRVYHMQDCCENVAIEDIDGNVSSLIGETIVSSEEIILDEWPEDQKNVSREYEEYRGSWTWTYHQIKTESGKEVTFKWLGTSNGYYSESIYCTRTHKPL